MADDLAEVRGDIESAIERVRVPSYVIDRHGIIRWLNSAAEKIVGDVSKILPGSK